jgi:hypothetical protein
MNVFTTAYMYVLLSMMKYKYSYEIYKNCHQSK